MAKITLAVSTQTPLVGNATYTSPSIDVSGYKIISGFASSDHAGTLYFDYQMPDGTTWVNVKSTALTTSIQWYEYTIGALLRFRYINGGTDQGSFNFAAYLELR